MITQPVLTAPLLRPYLYAMLRRNEAFSIVLLFQSITSSLFILAIWETAHVCFEVYATQVSKITTAARVSMN